MSSADSEGATEMVAGGLEEICKRRACWGTGVYTDDSDVVAAAIHSGWIKGDFGDFNEDLKELFEDSDDEEESPAVPTTLKEKPSRPVHVPSEMDMHVTILLLPPLQQYAATNMHHLRSRSWGSDHDGMSYQIHAIDFVNEPRPTRYMERHGVARRERIKDDLRRRREAAESMLGLTAGGSIVSVGA